MHFAYEGFTHNGGADRCFQFRGVDKAEPVGLFRIEVELRLFSQNRVPVQDGPQFCLRLLEAASAAEPSDLDRFHSYSVVSEDFRPLLVEREKQRAAKALKTPPRRAVRKPSLGSNVLLGAPFAQR
jgi:hypothetical protein